MTPDPSEPPPPAMPPIPAAPPVRPGVVGAPPRPPVWPTVLGVIGIALGALGALGSAWGIIAPFLMDFIAEYMPQGEQGVAAFKEHALHSAIYSFVALCLSVLLLVGSAALVRRRRSSARTLRVYALLKIPEALWGVWLTYLAQTSQMRALEGQPGAPPPALVDMIGMLTVAVALVWSLSLPVFLLAWFSRERIKSDIERWFA
ncbi:MAG: hypothetical protein SFY69_08745 [Planctomycetota bacterium]|nr:hypothetical protein [Planctomycetota bacterium]